MGWDGIGLAGVGWCRLTPGAGEDGGPQGVVCDPEGAVCDPEGTVCAPKGVSW